MVKKQLAQLLRRMADRLDPKPPWRPITPPNPGEVTRRGWV